MIFTDFCGNLGAILDSFWAYFGPWGPTLGSPGGRRPTSPPTWLKNRLQTNIWADNRPMPLTVFWLDSPRFFMQIHVVDSFFRLLEVRFVAVFYWFSTVLTGLLRAILSHFGPLGASDMSLQPQWISSSLSASRPPWASNISKIHWKSKSLIFLWTIVFLTVFDHCSGYKNGYEADF